MKHILILAPSRNQAHDFLVDNQWINHGSARIVHSPKDLRGLSNCLVLALPGWQHSPSVDHPRTILEEMTRRNMQLVALEQDVAYRIAQNQYDGRNGNGYQPLPVLGGVTAMPPGEL